MQPKNGALHPLRFALGRICAWPAPLVLIAKETVCTPLAPVAIEGFEHVAPSGNPLHAKLTPAGNVVAPTGVTIRPYVAVCPAIRVCVVTLRLSVSVNSELNVTGVACATCAASVPTPLIVNPYDRADPLFTVTVNGAPEAVGVTVVGASVQVGGAPAPHVRLTGLA
jgi:hypothetical protein